MLAPLLLRRPAHASAIAIVGLVAANCVPLLGVILFGWSLTTIIALYWAENGVVGAFAIGRMLTAGSGRNGRPALDRVGCAPFFLVHYGMFWAVHGVFVWVFLPFILGEVGGGGEGQAPVLGTVLLALPFLVASHGLSFYLNWIRGGEFRASDAQAEMQAPYARVVVLHLTILLGAFAVTALGTPIWAMVVMVVVKTALDAGAHLAERGRAALRAGARGVALAGRQGRS